MWPARNMRTWYRFFSTGSRILRRSKKTCTTFSYSGHGKEMSVIVNVAGPEYENVVQVFFDRLSMREPVVTGNVWNGNDKAPLNNTGGGQVDYIYEVPAGWTPQKYADGGVVIT